MPNHSWNCPTRKATPPNAVSPSKSAACFRLPAAAAAHPSTFVRLVDTSTKVSTAVKKIPSSGSPGCRHGWRPA